MGFRIHRVLGYGVTDLQTERFHSTDPRWGAPTRDLFEDMQEKIWDDKLSLFQQWLKDNPERIKQVESLCPMAKGSFLFPEDWKSSVQTVFEPEFGNPSVLMFVPPEMPTWSRRDDSIDYYDWVLKERNGWELQEFPISRGIYPWDNEFHPVEPGVIPDPEYITGSGRLRIGALDKAPQEVISYYKREWSPTIPISLLMWFDYIGCFPDPYGPNGIARCLRPLIYTYWS